MVVRMQSSGVQTRQFASAFASQAAHMLTAELHHIASSPRGNDVRPPRERLGGVSHWSVFVVHMVRRRHTERASCMIRTSSTIARGLLLV